MPWEPLGASRRTNSVPATIATSAGEGRLPPFLHITLRTGLLPTLPFIGPRGGCQVLFGRGAEAARRGTNYAKAREDQVVYATAILRGQVQAEAARVAADAAPAMAQEPA